MQIENFKDTILKKLKEKVSPLYEKATLLLTSIDENIQAPKDEAQYKTTLFAALVSFWKNNIANQNFVNMDSQLLLINWFIPLIPTSVVASLHQQLGEMLEAVLQQNPDNYLTVTYGLSIIGQLLIMSQTNKLNSPTVNQQFSCLLKFTFSDKKPIRKTSCRVLKQFIEQRSFDIFGSNASHFKTALNAYFKENLCETNESCQHSISLLGMIFKFLPFTNLADIMQLIIQHLTLQDYDNFPHIFLVIETILCDRVISEDILEKIILQLIQIQLDQENINLCHAYIQCLRQCVITLNELSQSQNGALFIPTIISLIVEFILSGNEKLSKLATSEVVKVLETVGEKVLKAKPTNSDILSELLSLNIDSEFEQNSNNQLNSNIFHQKYLAIIRYLLSKRFEGVQTKVLDIIRAFFGSLREDTFVFAKQFVFDFVSSKSSFHKKLFEKTIGQLIESVPLTQILELIPVNLQICSPLDVQFEDRTNVWLIQIVHQYGKTIPLNEFFVHIVPLLQYSIQSYQHQKNQGEGKIFFNLIQHLFEICPKCIINQALIQNTDQFKHHLHQFIKFIQQLMSGETDFYKTMAKSIIKLFAVISRNSFTSKILNEYSQPFISILAKKVSDVHQNNSASLSLIQVFSYHATQDYLQKAIFKNFEKIQQNSGLTNQEDPNFKTSLKNMDIILSVVGAVEFNVDIWNKCIEICSSLLAAQNKFQKKAYKFLGIIITKAHYTFLDDLQQLLLSNSKNVLISSKAKRFTVILKLLQEQFGTIETQESRFTVYDFQIFIQNFLPEIITSVKDQNQKTRIILRALLQNIGNKLNDIQQLDSFISMVLAGLAGESSLMKANAIATISILIDIFYQQLSKEFIQELTNIVTLMIKDQNNEIYKSVILFLRQLLKCQRKYSLGEFQNLAYIFKELFSSDQRKKNKVLIRKFIQKMIQHLGVKKIQEALPEEHKKLISKIIKAKNLSENRKKRQKRQNLINRQKLQGKAKGKGKEKVNDGDSDMENEGIEIERKGGMEMEGQGQGQGQMKLENENENDNLLLKYDFNKQKFHFTQNQMSSKPKQKTPLIKGDQEVEFKNGKILINEVKNITGKKRRRENQDEETETNQMQIEQSQKNVTKIKKTKNATHIIKESGSMYKPKDNRTGGDLILPDRPQPFAFIQLNPKVLNKRFRAQSKKAFDQILSKSSFKGIKVDK